AAEVGQRLLRQSEALQQLLGGGEVGVGGRLHRDADLSHGGTIARPRRPLKHSANLMQMHKNILTHLHQMFTFPSVMATNPTQGDRPMATKENPAQPLFSLAKAV